ncbi:MAG: CPBP family intramembrane glutamic endopeptidase [Candidatus Nanopelagicales bacterium]
MEHGPDGSGSQRRDRAGPVLGALILLLAVNMMNNVLAPRGYLLWTSLGVLGMFLLGRADGLQPQQWGLGRVTRRAAVAALALGATTCVAMLMGTRLPGVSEAFTDVRVLGMSGPQVTFNALVRVPFGTVLFEEVAFRGVLLAMLVGRFGLVAGAALSSLAFGAWHLPPAFGVVTGNAAVQAALGSAPLLAVTVAAAAAAGAGAFLCLLRIRYDHLIVPMAVHLVANGFGYLAAWLLVG